MVARTPALFSTMRAVLATGPPKKGVYVGTKPIPSRLGAGQILVRVKAVALNPTDWKNASLADKDCLTGCDFAGIVENTSDLKAEAPPFQFKNGDRVAGFVHGNLTADQGSFTEMVRTDANLVWRMPSSASFPEAAAIGGIAGSVAVQALFIRLGLPMPDPNAPVVKSDGPKPVFLVWSGASSVGCYAIQLAKLAGFKVVTAAPPKDFEYLKTLGADACFDFADKDVVAKVKAAAVEDGAAGITHGLDCFSQYGSTVLAADCFGEKGGRLITLLPPSGTERADVEVTPTVVYTVLGKPFSLWGRQLEASPSDREKISKWYAVCGELVGKGLLKPNRLRHEKGGLDGIEDALELLKSGVISAEKIVLTI